LVEVRSASLKLTAPGLHQSEILMKAIGAGVLWLASVTGAHAGFPVHIERHAHWIVLNNMPVPSYRLQERGTGVIIVVASDEDVGAAFALGAGTALDDGGDIIAFCRPRAWAAEPCVCSVEWIETLISADAFVVQMRQRRAVGAASAAELRAAIRNVHEVCGERAVMAPLEALGPAARQVEPSQAPRRTGAVRSSGVGTP
jgi:hypothetical protein